MGLAFAVAYPLSERTEPSSEAASWPNNGDLSNSINYPPSENAGAVIISIACVVLSWAFAVRWAENSLRLGPHSGLAWLNELACWLGQAALVVGPLGVAACPLHLYPNAHYAFAYETFYGGAAYICIQSYLDHVAAHRGRGTHVVVRSLRLGLIAMGAVCMLLYWIFFGLVGKRSSSLIGEDAAPAHAVLEIACMCVLLAYVASLGWTQRHMTTSLEVALPRRRAASTPSGDDGEDDGVQEPLLKRDLRTAEKAADDA
jgi:hypothetical protein